MLAMYPWTAVVGQDALKHALLLCAIDPAIGGVLVQGPRGVAKTTLARALAELVPGQFVELPLGATEERVTGTLNLDAVLRDGRVEFAPGLLARAHDGVLYVDEVNLLPDALVDLLLDAAASGKNVVERDGVSHVHPARFVLIGSMNPEEGELRPQLIDRFGLAVFAAGEIPPAERVQIVARRLEFDRDPEAFRRDYAVAQRALIERCRRARERATSIALHGPALQRVAEKCHAAGVEGVRADLAMLRAARAHAAWHERVEITAEDVDAVAELALGHRRGKGGEPEPTGGGSSGTGGRGASGGATSSRESRGAEAGAGAQAPSVGALGSEPGESRGAGARAGAPATREGGPSALPSDRRDAGAGVSEATGAIAARPVRALAAGRLPRWVFEARGARAERRRRGRRQRTAADGQRARAFAARGAIDWFATFVAARRPRRDQLRYRARARPTAQLWVVAVDCSASMLQAGGLAVAKGIAHAFEREARRAGAHLALISFRGGGATHEVTSAPGRAVLARAITGLGGGGGTPLRHALLAAQALCRSTRWRAPDVFKRLVVLTDGRSRDRVADLAGRVAGVERVVIDCERGRLRLGRSRQLAAALDAAYVAAAERA